jgi:hypothetical protein
LTDVNFGKLLAQTFLVKSELIQFFRNLSILFLRDHEFLIQLAHPFILSLGKISDLIVSFGKVYHLVKFLFFHFYKSSALHSSSQQIRLEVRVDGTHRSELASFDSHAPGVFKLQAIGV